VTSYHFILVGFRCIVILHVDCDLDAWPSNTEFLEMTLLFLKSWISQSMAFHYKILKILWYSERT